MFAIDETTQLRVVIALVSASAETPVGLGQSECDSRFRRWLASNRDVGVIETTHAARDGRTTNVYVPTTSRATPQMQERDPRRDVLGCNR